MNDASASGAIDTGVGSTRFRLTAPDLKRLTQRRDAPALLRGITQLLCVAAAMGVMWRVRGTWWMLPMFWVIGYPLAFLFNMLHETAHKTAFRRAWLNSLFGHIAGFLCLLPYHYYRSFHWDHHRYTQQPGKDPEMGLNLPRTWPGYVWLMLGFPVWYGRTVPLLLRRVVGDAPFAWITDENRARILKESRCYLLGYVLVAAAAIGGSTWAPVYLWLLPLAAGHMLLRPYLLAEHTGCSHSRDLFENTRTTYTNGLVRWFAWNMPYHAEHHAYPAVPFHSLPALNQLTREHLRETADGYVDANRRVRRFLLDKVRAPHTAI